MEVKNYERAGVVNIDYLSNLTDELPKKIGGKHKHNYVEFTDYDGKTVLVKTDSQRYAVFKKSVKCSCCGIEGKFLAVERIANDKSHKFHFNLYGVNQFSEEVLMTKDHIIPKSRDGKNTLENYQTMCSICNGHKKNQLNDEILKTTLDSLKENSNELKNRIGVLRSTKEIDVNESEQLLLLQKEIDDVLNKIIKQFKN